MNLKRSKGRILLAICFLAALSFEGISASTSTPKHDPSKEDFATSTRNWSETSRQLVEGQKDDKELNGEADTPHALRRRVKSEKGSKKGSKKAKESKAPKAAKQTKATKAQGELQGDLAKAIALKEHVQAAFKYDVTSARLCMNASDNHQRCVYEILVPGTDFACECRPTNGAEVFGEVDANDDDFITLAEILSYFDGQECDLPFKYTFEGVTKSYDSCTTVDDDFGFSWCSIRTLADGSHATGFFKYCDESSNILVWNDALARLDSDGDGKLSFDEAIHNARRRKLLLAPGAFTKLNCNDCVVPDDCANPVIKAIDGECRNYIKTKKLDDPNLLRLLASTMADVYCPKDDEAVGGGYSHVACERKRGGMENWLTRDDANMKMYDEDAGQLYTFLACGALAVAGSYNAGAVLLGIANGLLNYFESDWGVTSDQCVDVLGNMSSRLDGKDALQYATYTINQGPHQGKTILAFMGTDFTNIEQVMADIWSTPMATDMMKNMANEAKDVAERLNPDFITGHSLGGILAEMVCSMTGIKGASFGAIGAFDPFTRIEEAAVDGVEFMTEAYATTLSTMGYDEDDIEQFVSNLNVGEVLIRTEYNGLILDTQHDDVEFEVVMNVHDIPARTISSIDGSACSHIASSCDLRWTWFGGGGFLGLEKTAGHSSTHYMFNTNSKWTRGYKEESQATIDYTKIFLPDVSKNTMCDFCDRNEYCESGSCDITEEKCLAPDGKLPTKCPGDSATPGAYSDCDWSWECSSGRCEMHSNVGWAALGYNHCYDKLDNSEGCNEDTDCASGYCNWSFVCASKKNIGESCVEHDDCSVNYCNWSFTCGKKNIGESCGAHADCHSNYCNWWGWTCS